MSKKALKTTLKINDMSKLKNTPWHTVLIQWDRSLHKVVDSEGFTIVEETDEPTAKAIAALPDTLKRLEKLEKAVEKTLIQLEGESWLDMRNRIKPKREAQKKEMEDFIKYVAKAFNNYKPQDND